MAGVSDAFWGTQISGPESSVRMKTSIFQGLFGDGHSASQKHTAKDQPDRKSRTQGPEHREGF